MSLAEAKARRAEKEARIQLEDEHYIEEMRQNIILANAAKSLGISRQELEKRQADRAFSRLSFVERREARELENLADFIDNNTDEDEDDNEESAGPDIHWDCLDCGVDTDEIKENYMVTEDVWLTAHPDDDGKLCIGCLEARLGRQLTTEDFTKALINYPVEGHTSARMLHRVGDWEKIPEDTLS